MAHFSDIQETLEEQTAPRVTNVTVRAYDWKETMENGSAAIHCWALDPDSNPVLVRFPNYNVSCRFELPRMVYQRGRGAVRASWDEASAAYVASTMRDKLKDHGPTFSQFQILKHVYYYGREGPYLTVFFQNRDAMRHAINLMKKGIQTDRWGWIKMEAFEYQFDSVRKLCTLKNLEYCQWFTVQCNEVASSDKIAKCYEVVGNANTITPLSPVETKDWKANPGILSWDIEVYSHNPRLFPDKFNRLHEAYMVSAVYEKPDKNGNVTRRRYGIVIGECNESKVFPEAVMIRVKSEIEMVQALARVVEETDPEIMCGYNIFSFDIPYLNQRVLAQACTWPNISRLLCHQVHMKQTTWKSSAYGLQKLGDLDMPGRISLDLLPIITRDYKLPLNSLNFVAKKFLNKEKHDVSAPEMFAIYERNRKAVNLPPGSPEKIASVEEMTKVMEYCIQDSELVLLLIKKLNVWIGLLEMASIMGVTPLELFTRGQQVRCFSQIYDLAFHMGFVINSRDVPGYHYSGALVYPTVTGFHENVLVLDFASLYPSIMQAYNISHDTFVPLVPGPNGTMIQDPNVSDEDCHVIKFTQLEPERAVPVHNKYGGDHEIEVDLDDQDEEELEEKPKGRKKKAEVKMVEKPYVFRFHKGRPGLLKILEEKMVGRRRAVNREISGVIDAELDFLDGCHKIYLSMQSGRTPTQADADEYSNRKQNNGKFDEYYQKFVKMTPELQQVEYVRFAAELDSRTERMTYLSTQRAVLDKRQLAIKVSCNSFYGFLGVHEGGKLPLIEGAMCITALGRELITQAADYVKTTYNAIQVAGDTDSFMIKLPFLTDPEQCWYWGQRLSQEISGIAPGGKDIEGKVWPEGRRGLFPPPLKMEFEKAIDAIFLKPKFYSAYFLDDDGKHKTKTTYDAFGKKIREDKEMLLRGSILVRRDNCSYTKKVYKPITINILERIPFEESWKILFSSVLDLIKGQASLEDLTMIKGLGDNYKSKTNPMYVFSQYLQSIGKPQEPGSRLPYLVVGTGVDAVGSKMRLQEQMVEGSCQEKINIEYYLSNVMSGPLDTLIGVGYRDFIEKLNVSFTARKGCKPTTLLTPVKFIYKYLKYSRVTSSSDKVALLENLNKMILDRCAVIRMTTNV